MNIILFPTIGVSIEEFTRNTTASNPLPSKLVGPSFGGYTND